MALLIGNISGTRLGLPVMRASFLVLIILLLLNCKSYCQQFGFSVNTSRSYLVHPGESYSGSYTKNYTKLRYGGGIDVRFRLKPKLYFATGISFSNFQYLHNRNYTDDRIAKGDFNFFAGYTFYHVPLLPEYVVFNKKKIDIVARLGVKIGLITNTQIGYHYNIIFKDTIGFVDSSSFNNVVNFYPLLHLGIGVGYTFKKGKRVQLNAGYDISFLRLPESVKTYAINGHPFDSKFSPLMNYLVFSVQVFPFVRN